MRFRISTDLTLGSTGAAADGEVMDALQTIQFDVPNGGYGMVDFGDGAMMTLLADNGARHLVSPHLFIGGMPDGELDGVPSSIADGDDAAGADDEDGFNSYGLFPVRGMPVAFPVTVTNTGTVVATLHGFVDWSGDGDFADAGEVSNIPVPAGSTGITVMLPWTVPLTASTSGPLAVRLRLASNPVPGPFGPAADGEVEDHLIGVTTDIDFGDLPDPGYVTKFTSGGPFHPVSPNIYIGGTPPDPELDGLPSSSADGDDMDAMDDEDGIDPTAVKAVPGFQFNMSVDVTNVTTSAATLTGFVDWNGDGDFLDANESVSKAVPAPTATGNVKLLWDVPLAAVTAAPVAVRLRLATGGALPAGGFAPNGEVEDFFINVIAEGIDYGDLPDSVTGTGPGLFGTSSPPDYKTTLADGGPSHVMRPGLHLSNDSLILSGEGDAHLDPESDGQPSSSADGDNVGGENDEGPVYFTILRQTFTFDGVHSYATLMLHANHAMTNTTGETAQMTGFLDVNNDGDFDDPGEKTRVGYMDVNGDGDSNDPGENSTALDLSGTSPLSVGGPVFTFNYNLAEYPAPGITKTLAVRTRLTTDSDIGPDGPASDGEVQDDLVSFTLSRDSIETETMMDYGDLDNTRYRTLWAQDGARHAKSASLFMGTAATDGEVNGFSSVLADGDDTSSGTNDEDVFVTSSPVAYWGQPFNVPVPVTNSTTSGATLYGFADWNDDGDFNDSGETATAAVAPGTVGASSTLAFSVPATPGVASKVALRLRLSPISGLGAAGNGGIGEVEDHLITMAGGWDFGDLPDVVVGTSAGVLVNLSTVSQGDYRTRLADDGPRHLIRPDLVLFNDWDPGGIHVDTEADGIPTVDASGDDYDGPNDDEEGLLTSITRHVITSATAVSADSTFDLYASIPVKNETGGTAYLTGFLDANNDGDFSDTGETVTVNIPSAVGYSAQSLTFSCTTVLTDHITSWTSVMPVRFRLSTTSGLGAEGGAPDGEVEDYMVSVRFATSRWWPTTPGCDCACDYFADKGTPIRVNAFDVLPPGFISGSNYKWHFGSNTEAGINPLLEPSLLEALGTGCAPFSLSVGFFPQSIGSYAGCISIRDLAEFRSFMVGHSLIGETASPDMDADGDGTSNFIEYAFGTNPSMQTAPPQMVPRVVIDGGSSYFTGAYLRRTGGTTTGATYATAEVSYQPEASKDLVDWTQPVTGAVAPSDLPLPPPGYEWGAVRIPSILSEHPKGFLRLEICRP
jgi:GEVED domain